MSYGDDNDNGDNNDNIIIIIDVNPAGDTN